MNYIGKGNSVRKASELFGVGTTTIKEWKRLKKETGKMEIKVRKREPKKLDPVQLKTYISEKPDSYLREIADVFKCNESAVRRAFKRLGITRKKN
jgi:transposase